MVSPVDGSTTENRDLMVEIISLGRRKLSRSFKSVVMTGKMSSLQGATERVPLG